MAELKIDRCLKESRKLKKTFLNKPIKIEKRHKDKNLKLNSCIKELTDLLETIFEAICLIG